jgi:hypothetical protein
VRIGSVIEVDRVEPTEAETRLWRLAGEFVPGLAQKTARSIWIGNSDHDGRIVSHVAKPLFTLTQRKLYSLFLLDEYGHQIKWDGSQEQKMLQGKSGVARRASGKRSNAMKGSVDAIAPVAPNMPNRMAAQNMNGTGA